MIEFMAFDLRENLDRHPQSTIERYNATAKSMHAFHLSCTLIFHKIEQIYSTVIYNTALNRRVGVPFEIISEIERHVLYHITGLTSSEVVYSSDE